MGREKRIQQAMSQGMFKAMFLAFPSILLMVLAEHVAQGGLLRGLGVALMVALPISLIVMTYRGFQAMDEYGKNLMQKACTMGFMVVMGLSMVYYPLQMVFHLPPLPLWVLWTVGSVTYGIAMAVQARS